MQPGSVIQPNQPEGQKPQAEAVPQTTQAPVNTPEPTQPVPEALPATDEFKSSGFSQSEIAPQETQPPTLIPEKQITWSASEYISHQKQPSWYFGLGAAGLFVSILVFLITRDFVTTGVFPIVAILFGIFAARQPHVLQYSIVSEGLIIGQRRYVFEDFKSFTVHQGSSLPSVFFLPTKRFTPGLTVYFPPEQSNEIIDTLSLYLPHEEREPDIVDRLMQRVRF